MLLVVTRKQHLSEFPWYNSSIFCHFFSQSRLPGNFSWCWSDIFVNSLKNTLQVCLCLKLGLHLVSWCNQRDWLKSLFVVWPLRQLPAFSCPLAACSLYLCLVLCCLSESGSEGESSIPSLTGETGNTGLHLRCLSISKMPMQTWLVQQRLAGVQVRGAQQPSGSSSCPWWPSPATAEELRATLRTLGSHLE